MRLPLVPQCNPIDAKPSGAETLILNFSLPAGRYVRIDWGDGGTTKVTGPVSSQNYSNAYAGAGTYPIRIYGDFRFLTKFEIKDVNVDGTLERIGAMSDLTYLLCDGSNTISGDIAGLPSGLTYFRCIGQNTISGDVAGLPSGLTYFYCIGQNTVSGDIAGLPSGLTYFLCQGSNTISDYTTLHTWTTKPGTFILVPTGAGGLSTAEIDNLLIDFDADLTWAAGNTITLTGTNAAPTAAPSAAATAIANMAGEGCTITTN